MKPLYSLPNVLIKANVLARPSKKVKSPYLADIEIDGVEYLCHSPALGCSGHIVEGATVWVLQKNGSKTKSSHEIYLIQEGDTMIGAHPLVANKIAQVLLKQKMIIPNIKNIYSEFTVDDCRFDFIGQIDNKMAVIEIKSVPMADYYDGTQKEVNELMKENTKDKKIAIFPFESSRKLMNDPKSPRALKHIETLKSLAKEKYCMLLYIVQRDDVDSFCISKLDPIYKEAVKKAMNAGVHIKAVSIRWDTQHCYFDKELPIVW